MKQERWWMTEGSKFEGHNKYHVTGSQKEKKWREKIWEIKVRYGKHTQKRIENNERSTVTGRKKNNWRQTHILDVVHISYVSKEIEVFNYPIQQFTRDHYNIKQLAQKWEGNEKKKCNISSCMIFLYEFNKWLWI